MAKSMSNRLERLFNEQNYLVLNKLKEYDDHYKMVRNRRDKTIEQIRNLTGMSPKAQELIGRSVSLNNELCKIQAKTFYFQGQKDVLTYLGKINMFTK